MSQLLAQVLQRNFQLHLAHIRPRLQALHVALTQLQYCLAPLGCTLSPTAQDWVLWRAHQWQPSDSNSILATSNDELTECLARVCAHLAKGKRCHNAEYHLVALLYDCYNGVQNMAELQPRFERVFHWIAIDAALRQLGNESGFKLA